jgi:hypothetical protein
MAELVPVEMPGVADIPEDDLRGSGEISKSLDKFG